MPDEHSKADATGHMPQHLAAASENAELPRRAAVA